MKQSGGKVEPKFEDCRGCRHFDQYRQQPICKRCGFGEHFTEKDRPTELSERDLWKIYRGMTDYDD